MPILGQWISHDLNKFQTAQGRWTRKAENSSFEIISWCGPRIQTQCSITLLWYMFQEKKGRLFTKRRVWIPGVKIKLIPLTNFVPSSIGDLRAFQLTREHNVWEHLNNITQRDRKSETPWSIITNWSLQEARGVKSHGLSEEFQAV